MTRSLRYVFLPLLVVGGTLQAQQAPVGCRAPEHRQFDYWVGDWEVTDSAGATVYGTNLVTLEESGCVVHEHWTGSRGGTGQSFNYWDPQRKVWQQDWVASGGTNLHLVGKLQEGVIVLEADVPAAGGGTAHHKAMWIPQRDGRVRQYWRQTTDGGKSWTVVFDGYYRKK